jgi:hypothetical protein
MNCKASGAKPKLDISKLEYESPPHGYIDAGDCSRYVKWESVPQEIKNNMFNHIKEWIDKQSAETNTRPYIYIDGFLLHIEKKMGLFADKNISILFSHAILEYLNTHKDLVPRPFTLTTNGRGWFINFIYNFS